MSGPKTDNGLIAGYRVRHDGWTPARQRTFLRALSQTGCVRDACARAGISNTSAYRMKKRSAAFARAWDRALAKAMPTIEQAAYERAVIGWEEPIVQGGKLVGHKRRYSDSLLRLLLQRGFGGDAAAKAKDEAGDGAAMNGSPRPGGSRGTRIVINRTAEEVNASLEKKLAAMERRLRKEGKLPRLPAPERA
ncbi:MAG: hypothetical protein ACTHM8_04705 [Sphingomonas sp.]